MTPAPDQLKAMQAEFNLAWMKIWKKISTSDRKASDKAGHTFCHQVAWEAWYAAKQTQLMTAKVNS